MNKEEVLKWLRLAVSRLEGADEALQYADAWLVVGHPMEESIERFNAAVLELRINIQGLQEEVKNAE